MTASVPGEQDIGPRGSGDGWLTARAVHRGSFVPLHRQIHDLVRQEIAAGRLAPGSRLPSEGAVPSGPAPTLERARSPLVGYTAVVAAVLIEDAELRGKAERGVRLLRLRTDGCRVIDHD